MAVMYYNDNDIDHSLTYLKSAKLHSPISCDKAGDICKRIWYLDRLLNLTKSADIKSQWHEDSKCNKQGSYSTSLCSESNLTSINDDISGLGANGYVSQFYNSKQPISILQKPIEAFISDLHSFIIVSLIAGPIIFVISIKHFGGNKSDKEHK